LTDSKSSSIHRICRDASEEKSIYRLLNNPKVTEDQIIDETSNECKVQAKGKRVLVLNDTTIIKLSNKLNRLQDLEGLYPIGSTGINDLYGFHVNPSIVLDEQSQFILGLSNTKIVERDGRPRKKQGDPRARFKENIEDKESYKWLESCKESKRVLDGAEHVTFVMDREADTFELYDRIPDKTSSLLIRSSYNRRVILNDGSEVKMEDLMLESEVKGHLNIRVETKKRKQRIANLYLKYETVYLKCPAGKKTKFRNQPEGIKVTIIDVKEKKHKGYKNEPALHWRLISTDEINCTMEAIKQVEFYKRRWKIEEFFKLLKTDGYDIEGTQLTRGKSIRKLTLFIMKASIKVMKLKAARDGNNEEKIESVFNKDEIECINLMNRKLEGNTEKQKNPHDPKLLSFASWVIARLGGWKEFYNAKRPPGNKTFIYGLEKFDAIMIGFIAGR